jgi:thiol-disulfide isomerase/thioredoxin
MKRAAFILLAIAASVWVAMTLTSTRDAGVGSAIARDGSTVDVASVPGAPMTIVHFWGTWCPPCRHELPGFVAFQRDVAGRGIAFVTVADDPDFATVDRFLSETGLTLDPVYLDPRGSAARTWNVNAYPTTFVVGPSNEILAVYKGMIDWASPLQRREIMRLGKLGY